MARIYIYTQYINYNAIICWALLYLFYNRLNMEHGFWVFEKKALFFHLSTIGTKA